MAVVIQKKNLSLENEFLKISINLSSAKVSSFSLFNKINSEEIKGEKESELFVLNFKGGLFNDTIAASELKISTTSSKETEANEQLVINFSPVKIKGNRVWVTLIYELEKTKHYFRKYLKFKCEQPNQKATLDYIDFFPIVTGLNLKTRCLPAQESSHISGNALSIGQPVFVSSAFLGCEFPATINTVEAGKTCVKFYSGKNLSELLSENNEYISYKAVCGVASSDDEVVLHSALFDYIEAIAKSLEFRVQYNSWYDHMLNISAENIEQSFLEIEKAMTAVGTKPLDCFVVDDGWNDYEKDFWCFNKKFPNELYPSTALAKALGSNFGLWLGPRGGYTKDTVKFARKIENAGNGFVNKRSFDIDVASEKYINKLSGLMLDYQKKFDLKYWKLDGFAQKPCRNSNHDHIVGGQNDMYFYTQVWERWIEVFSRLEKESENGIFINLTCYAPPSPWLLQWVNCMWIQVSDDMGVVDRDADGKKLSASKKDMMLTYRDDRYYDFLQKRKFVFPQSRIYNHDPIYANEAKVKMTDDEFRDYLFVMSARGNAFWELYYSFNLMNEEKWRINNCVLSFVRENLYLLKNSTMFGSKPSLGQVYGYGSFFQNEGIVMLRNSGGEPKNYVLRLDNAVGATKALNAARLNVIYPYNKNGSQGSYSYGDTVNVMLSPYQTKILSFGKQLKLMKAEYVKVLNNNTLEIMFNQTVVADDISCKQNKIVSSKLLDDYRSVELTFENDFDLNQNYTIEAVKDIFLFESSCEISFEYHKDNIIESGCIHGNGEFSIVATTGGEEVDLIFKQGEEIELSARNGKFFFRVGNTSVVSVGTTHDVVQLCAVRERNGVLKLYLNKHLDSGAKPTEIISYFSSNEVYRFDENKIKVYSKALSYSQV